MKAGDEIAGGDVKFRAELKLGRRAEALDPQQVAHEFSSLT
jgi:hypothetical protein